jgi:hypothetical protein
MNHLLWNEKILHFACTVYFMCFAWFSQQIVIMSPHSIKQIVFTMEMCIYVRQ